MRTLIRGTNWIGDSVMSLAALREIRRRFPQDRITLLTRKWVSGLFENQGLVDSIVHPEEAGGSGRLGALVKAMRGFDRAILFQNAFRAGLHVFLARIPERIGYSTDGRRFLLTRRAIPRIKELQEHQVFYYLDLLYQTGLSTVDYLNQPGFRADIHLTPSPGWIYQAERLLHNAGVEPGRPLITLNPGAFFGPAKRWFPERYAAVADKLIGETGAEIVIVGSEGEKRLALEIEEQMKERTRVLAGKTDLTTLIGVIATSSCMLTNDSGPMHLAAALGIPTVALFGSTDETATGPYDNNARVIHKHVECSPCLLRECPIDLRCFERITVEEVFQTVNSLLKNG